MYGPINCDTLIAFQNEHFSIIFNYRFHDQIHNSQLTTHASDLAAGGELEQPKVCTNHLGFLREIKCATTDLVPPYDKITTNTVHKPSNKETNLLLLSVSNSRKGIRI